MNAGQIAMNAALQRAKDAMDSALAAGDRAKVIRIATAAETGGYWPDEISEQKERFAEYAAKTLSTTVA